MTPATRSRPIPEDYLRLHFAIPVTEEDRLVAELWSLATLGIESVVSKGERRELLAYFDLPVTPELRRISQGHGTPMGAELVESREVAGRDWQAAFRKRLRPFPVGARWWVDPREPDVVEVASPEGRNLLRIPARTAFGIGSHASTALVVEMMDDLALSNKRVLDVGTGSGILAIVALRSGASRVTAFDIDTQAAFVAQQTCFLNGCHPQIFAGEAGSICIDSRFLSFDLILANVLPFRLRDDLSAIASCLEDEGSMILSGILLEQAPPVLSHVSRLGLRLGDRRESEEWVALRVEKDRP